MINNYDDFINECQRHVHCDFFITILNFIGEKNFISGDVSYQSSYIDFMYNDKKIGFQILSDGYCTIIGNNRKVYLSDFSAFFEDKFNIMIKFFEKSIKYLLSDSYTDEFFINNKYNFFESYKC